MRSRRIDAANNYVYSRVRSVGFIDPKSSILSILAGQRNYLVISNQYPSLQMPFRALSPPPALLLQRNINSPRAKVLARCCFWPTALASTAAKERIRAIRPSALIALALRGIRNKVAMLGRFAPDLQINALLCSRKELADFAAKVALGVSNMKQRT